MVILDSSLRFVWKRFMSYLTKTVFLENSWRKTSTMVKTLDHPTLTSIGEIWIDHIEKTLSLLMNYGTQQLLTFHDIRHFGLSDGQ